MKEIQRLPVGWSESGLESLIAHYDRQSEEEQAAEIDEALEDDGVTMVAVPVGLAEKVLAIIALGS